jgi:hypothetical protein
VTTSNPDQAQQRDKATGILVAGAIHAALLLLLFFFIKLSPPNPPWEDLGLEVNFGFDEAGYGNVSTTETAGTVADQGLQSNPDPAPNNSSTTAEDAPENINTTTAESPVEVPEKTTAKTEKPTPKVTNPNPTAKPNETRESGTGSGAKSSGGGGANDGNVKGAVGNQGDPNGNPDALNYGKRGGSSLQMTGWKWDEPPTPDDKSEATGKIVFEVKVDETGEIVGIKTLERTVDPSIVEKYKKAVEKLTFSKTRDNQNPAETSTGRITFVLKGD